MGVASDGQLLIRACCMDGDGTVLAESRHRNVANAVRSAQWLLDHVEAATRAAVPRAQYEVCR